MSRLDRLVLLLEADSATVRTAAAQQIAQIQKSHPHELFNLLGRVVPYLRSTRWDTRIAAVAALGGILEHTAQFKPNAHVELLDKGSQIDLDLHGVQSERSIKDENTPNVNFSAPLSVVDHASELFDLSSFDILGIIQHGKALLGSDGKEYDVDLSNMSHTERLTRAKKNVKARLGLGAEYIQDDFLSEHDLDVTPHGVLQIKAEVPTVANTTAVSSDIAGLAEAQAGLSARQRNMMKRKAKGQLRGNNTKIRAIDASVMNRRKSEDSSVPEVRAEAAPELFSITPQAQNDGKIVVEHKVLPLDESVTLEGQQGDNESPLAGLLDILLLDIYDPAWECRHGAARALQEILRTHASEINRRKGLEQGQNDKLNALALGDIACRLCSIFALDRFGDYVSDQVVAPIRETVSQTIAVLLAHLSAEEVMNCFKLLQQLIFQPKIASKAWEVTHGGMLGLKYLVAVRKDVLCQSHDLLDGTITAVLSGLANQDDDVRAVSAATLIPIASEFVTSQAESLGGLLDVLWDCLSDLSDDLSASTGSVMDLLAKLCSFPKVLQSMRDRSHLDDDHTFAILIPRLFVFLRHTITSVRAAVIRALQTILKADETAARTWIGRKFFRLLFQNILLEQTEDVRSASLTLWRSALEIFDIHESSSIDYMFDQSMQAFIELLVTPVGYARQSFALDESLLIRSSGEPYSNLSYGNRQEDEKTRKHNGKPSHQKDVTDVTSVSSSIDRSMIRGEVDLVGSGTIIRARLAAADALGFAISRLSMRKGVDHVQRLVQDYSSSQTSSARYMSMTIVQHYRQQIVPDATENDNLALKLQSLLLKEPAVYFSNLTPLLQIVRSQCQALHNLFIEYSRTSGMLLTPLPLWCLGEQKRSGPAFEISTAIQLVDHDYDRLIHTGALVSKQPALATLQAAKSNVMTAIEDYQRFKQQEDSRCAASYASAYLSTGSLPRKLNPLIKALMDNLKAEIDTTIQARTAQSLSVLVQCCNENQRSNAVDKLLQNLCNLLCSDISETPDFARHSAIRTGIYSLRIQRETTAMDPAPNVFVKKMGAQQALAQICERFGPVVFQKVEKLREIVFNPLVSEIPISTEERPSSTTIAAGQAIIDSMTVLQTLVHLIHPCLYDEILQLSHNVVSFMQSDFATLRYASANCFAQICQRNPENAMKLIISSVLPVLQDAGMITKRQGAIETIHRLVLDLDILILPYIIFLIVPVMGRMSDSDNDIRILATTTFASLIKLVPLEAGLPDPPGFSEELLESRAKERKFIEQMLNGSKVDAFKIPVAIEANLRSYQQEGVNWLAFLNRYQLHGILCDDMGLGKTLQTICMVASDHHNRAIEHQLSGSSESRALPSLVICPPSLTGHWQHELTQYAPFLTHLCYVGPPSERQQYRNQLAKFDIIVTSYDVARNDIEYFEQHSFNYCVLDEGHIIKNSKAKLTQAVKSINANHRLILSGTPVQNNVLELWSLFDFLMPGFLGTEKTFHERYAKPIANSRDSKTSSKEQQAGALALEALHKQVLPFLLRRLKEEVLADLPPKIIQDYYCELSPLQKSLYNDFAQSQASTIATETSGEVKQAGKSHVFQALQYMRKLCNHPALVLNNKHPVYAETIARLNKDGSSLRDIKHAPKLQALRDLLLDCGIGIQATTIDAKTDVLTTGVVNQHRALIFCQLKDMLDMVESDVLKKLLPTVSYMRLDGTTDPRNRQNIVQQFNSDPSIDLLLLTTHVGGLGLNLTGADTVIFVEHDWNPQKDLQAMDRAHRLGQKNTVNVYRLITRDTLEEKIMGLQKFKLNIASTIVNQQNSGLATMDTNQILDLFNNSNAETTKASEKRADGVDEQGNLVTKGQKTIFDDLEELHKDSEYEQFNLDSFVQTLT